MSEKPILFSGSMVRAILDGTKTQTRRVVKPQPIAYGLSNYGGSRSGWVWKPESLDRSWNDDDKDPYRNPDLATSALACECPYGGLECFLWVKETHYRWGRWVKNGKTKTGKQAFRFRAIKRIDSRGVRYCVGEDLEFKPEENKRRLGWHIRPSIFMPKCASRITLEIVNVRVDRVTSISENDARAEGVNAVPKVGDSPEHWTAKQAFESLWDSINAKRGFPWDANPFVWAIEFRRVKRPAKNAFPSSSVKACPPTLRHGL